MVGVVGLEPTACGFQSRRASQTAPHPEWSRREDSNPQLSSYKLDVLPVELLRLRFINFQKKNGDGISPVSSLVRHRRGHPGRRG